MSRTLKHKLNGKFNNGLITVKEMPMFMLKYWNRMNFWTGHYRHIRKETIAKSFEITDEDKP
jgi:hypothetical protein